MKLVTYQSGQNAPAAGAILNDRVVDLGSNVKAILRDGEAGLKRAAAVLEAAKGGKGGKGDAKTFALSDVTLHAPIRHPGKVLALAGNYRAHRNEGGSKLADSPLPEVFCKPVTSVIGSDQDILLPGPPIVAVDYEGELGVVMGRTARNVSEADAMAYVAGYLCLNDVSGRKLDPGFTRPPELEARAKFFDWLIGKWCDTFSPMGPWLVTADEIKDPMALTLITRVNGEERQRTSTGEMIHSIASTISWCSKLMTLEPGDVIATGTPAGVGSASGRFLKAGDVVEVEINGLGTLRNRVSA